MVVFAAAAVVGVIIIFAAVAVVSCLVVVAVAIGLILP